MSPRGLLRATLLAIATAILAIAPIFSAAGTAKPTTAARGLTLRVVTCEKLDFWGDGGYNKHVLHYVRCYLRPEDREARRSDHVLDVRLQQKPQALELKLKLRSRGADETGSNVEHDFGLIRLAEGESVVLEELEAFGIEPWSLKAISWKPPHLIRTRIENRTQNIRASVMQEGWTWAEVSVHNRSHKTVHHLEVVQISPATRGYGVSRMFPKISLAPGERGRVNLTLLRRLLGSQNDFAPDSRFPGRLEISTVVFEDGSFEGAEPLRPDMDRLRRSAR